MDKRVKKGQALRMSYNLTIDESRAFYKYLAGDINSRELGESVGMSHQGAISATSVVVKDWIRQGKLKFTNSLMQELFPNDKGMRYGKNKPMSNVVAEASFEAWKADRDYNL